MSEFRPSAWLGHYEVAVKAALAEMAAQRVLPRIWAGDHTVWKPQPNEITNRLGWLHSPQTVLGHSQEVQSLVQSARAAGYEQALLLGMGGSSLAPELFSKTLGPGRDLQPQGTCLHLEVLDSTDPDAVLAQAHRLDPERTLFIVSTKSGGTVETFSFFRFFYNWVAAAVGAERSAEHFVAITDPGSRLAEMATQYHFRAVFLNDPHIGGRYSALSLFGLVPAALVGADVPRLLGRAVAMAVVCGPEMLPAENPGAHLGAAVGELAKAGRDKATFVIPPALSSFGDWVEQLVAESLGKEGKGVLPVVGEPLGPPASYGDDRFFVHLCQVSTAPGPDDTKLADLQAAGFPVIRLPIRDAYDLGAQFFLWMVATAVAGQRLGVNPFDQPNVEAAKARAREMVAAYTHTGILPTEPAALSADGIAVYGQTAAASPAEALREFVDQARPGDYVALQAYVQPSRAADEALAVLRSCLRERLGVATTVGYGPRFLHSTGQLHKGDAGRGLFLQITTEHPQDVPIPDEVGVQASSITFGVLELAQSMGDRQALLAAGRRVMRFHLADPVLGLQWLRAACEP